MSGSGRRQERRVRRFGGVDDLVEARWRAVETGCVVLLGASGTASLALLLLAVAIAGAGQGLAFAASLTRADRVASWRGQGHTWAVFYTVTYLGEA